MKICKTCGNTFPDNVRFCKVCGSRLVSEEEVATQSTETAPTAEEKPAEPVVEEMRTIVPEPEPKPVPEPEPVPEHGPEPEPVPEPKPVP